MDYKYISQLLERYWQASTSLEEEDILRAFFSQADVPEELRQYRSLFVYEQEEPRQHRLGADFDARFASLLGDEAPVKARRVTLKARLAPLFRAAAIVAIILTLGNAAQFSFHNPAADGPATATHQGGSHGGASVAALVDSTTIDTLQKSSSVETPLPPEGATILK